MSSNNSIASLDELEQLIAYTKANKKILGNDFCAEVTKASKIFMKELSESVGKNILNKLHEKKPSEESLKAIITAVPSALLVPGEESGRIPIHTTLDNVESMKYVGLLAKEGIKYNVGGKGKRGGLLLEDNFYECIFLQALAGKYITEVDPLESTLKCLDVLKDLRKSKLLTIEDVRKYDLLYHACDGRRPMRFEYLSDWDPEALKLPFEEKPMVHEFLVPIFHNDLRIQTFLRAAFKHFPNELGLLFQRDDQEGTTALERAVSVYGKPETMAIIRKCISQDTSIPILHRVAQHTPQYINDFACHYPHAAYLKDPHGGNRTLCQARLASGHTTYEADPMFLIAMSPDQIETVDPVTDLYPFMVAASDDVCDLDAVYYLLRREPKLAYKTLDHHSRRSRRKRRDSAMIKTGDQAECKRVKI